AEQLRAPAQLLQASEREELSQGVPRRPLRRRAGHVLGLVVAVAEWSAGEKVRHAVRPIERGEQAVDVSRRAERARTWIVIGRDDAITERRERGHLVRGEIAATSAPDSSERHHC